MGRRRTGKDPKSSHTLPSSPSHSFSSSSSSDFEFTISLSPRKSSTNLIPADELFYKGQLLPLHLSPRLSMVRTLLLSSSSTSSSSDTTATASRDSTGSTSSSATTDSNSSFTADLILFPDCDSSRPSSVTEDDEFKRLNTTFQTHHIKKNNKYFSLSRFSSVFRKEPPKSKDSDDNNNNVAAGSSSVKRMSVNAKEVFRKYLKKVKPLYEKLSQKQQQKMSMETTPASAFSLSMKREKISVQKNARKSDNYNGGINISHSFSGNLRYPRHRSCVSSCPSSRRSSPTHSGVLSRNGFTGIGRVNGGSVIGHADSSSMEELQSAIQGAIAHCKNSMLQNKTMVSNEI